jgi:hypothetical protein
MQNNDFTVGIRSSATPVSREVRAKQIGMAIARETQNWPPEDLASIVAELPFCTRCFTPKDGGFCECLR